MRHLRHLRQWAGVVAVLVLGCVLGTGSVVQAHPAHDGTPTRPVLLVGGTFGPASYMDAAKAWFVGQGFTVYSMQLTGSPPGSDDIKVSAQAVCDEIDAIRTQTGAGQVDVVGHSQGALAVRYCVKYQGGLSKVATMVSLGGVDYGTSRAFLCASTACRQMRPGSSFLTELNAGDDTPGTVHYVKVWSYPANGGIAGEDAPLQDGATNVGVQDRCPGRTVEHRSEYDDGAQRDLLYDAFLQFPLTTTCP
jgi:triacylglycerol esterase/lipase EstA (alpha/beta hydrolase family)